MDSYIDFSSLLRSLRISVSDLYLTGFVRERTSRFLEQSTGLAISSRLLDQLAFIVSSCRILVRLAQQPATVHSDAEGRSELLSNIPEFLVDNIVDFVSYLRRMNDNFIEVNLQVLILFVFMLIAIYDVFSVFYQEQQASYSA
ncbi:unnamed protein product [Protopolystoma xenopodis]|uniref:Ubiquitin conjugation factor E4 core domain-containing protein n=1 Tax=Protopolystoma xenopodis TaxID=117903 RepID=A0A448XMW1_9PLAT|nr:unnamed protein product [Protopolystoma xenopodis]